jgi:hypothetical protein
VDEQLIDLLRSLAPSEWELQTVASLWKVRDVAAHLLYHPVLDCFLRGLPHAFRYVEVPLGAVVAVVISGECGGQWLLSRGTAGWNFVGRSTGDFAARVTVPQELAWRLFTMGIDRDSARAQLEIEGDRDLGERILNLTAIVG